MISASDPNADPATRQMLTELLTPLYAHDQDALALRVEHWLVDTPGVLVLAHTTNGSHVQMTAWGEQIIRELTALAEATDLPAAMRAAQINAVLLYARPTERPQ